jgi:2-polyprenyl-3-methyl-5-hydroxy-6-metoxy-1,4-benzoquinol methylase
MLAPRTLPQTYEAWNRKWSAPWGKEGYGWPLRGTRLDAIRRGPFAWQTNNSTRIYEYPWAYDKINQLSAALTIVDIGGSLGGMQFVLASEGHRVINVDPGLRAGGLGWNVDLDLHKWLCKRYKLDITVISENLSDAPLDANSVDVFLSVSSLEHFSTSDLDATARCMATLLKPTGIAVITADCFLDLKPFTTRTTNKWGTNISVHEFLEAANLRLSDGNPKELLGFPEWDTDEILSQLSNYHVGTGYPCLAQCFTATPMTR